ncbi:MAG TPA: VWA domain-containing protein, partial [Dehalococcoidia bacterium]|nr:VWA domain-containing protein [Dehalococcoidia bacterium]
RGIAWTARYTWKGVTFVFSSLRLLIQAFFKFIWKGFTAILKFLRQCIITLLKWIWFPFDRTARGIAWTARYAWKGVTFVFSSLWLLIQAFFKFLRIAVSTTIKYISLGIVTLLKWICFPFVKTALGIAWTARYLWAGVTLVFSSLWLLIQAFFNFTWKVFTEIFNYLWLMIFAPFKYIWLGVKAVFTVIASGIKHVFHGIQVVITKFYKSFISLIKMLGTGCAVIIDMLKFGWQRVVRVLLGNPEFGTTELNLTRERLRALAVTIVVLFTIFGVSVKLALPEPTINVVHWTTGHLVRDGLLMDMAKEFNESDNRIASGTRIVVQVCNVPSELQGKYLTQLIKHGTRIDLWKETNGYVDADTPDPVIVTPSSAHWLVTTNHEVERTVVDLENSLPIVRPVIGIVTYEEMAKLLGWPDKEIGYADIIELCGDPDGWSKYSEDRYGIAYSDKWGQEALLAFTDPVTSSTGRSLYLGLYAIAANKLPQDLTEKDVQNPEVVEYIKNFQTLIDHYLIGTTVLNTKIHQGPRYGHFFIMPEDNLIHLYEGTEKAYELGRVVTAPPLKGRKQRMVMIYPKEGSMPRNNIAGIVQADWVTEEQVEASQQWIEFIRRDKQQKAFMAAGFRPGTDLDLHYPGSKITAEYGLDPDEPRVVLNPSYTKPDVAQEICEAWEFVKRPGIVTYVVDNSGSMIGNKLDKTKKGLNLALNSMATNNQVGFVTFNDAADMTIPVRPLEENRGSMEDAVDRMEAQGETALYDAIKKGIEMTDTAEGDENAIRAVVVLTDGQANRGTTELDDLILMESDPYKIIKFAGMVDSIAYDERGMPIPRDQITGVDLAVETRHPVQIFFIGIGDADLDIGRMLSEATGAEYQGVEEEDLANVLEEFSKYF